MQDARAAVCARAADSDTAAHVAGWRRPAVLGAVASLALAAGWLVYATDRSASHVLLVPGSGALAGSAVFGSLGQWLPSFVHPLAFSLFTVLALPPSQAPRYGICLAWAVVNLAFEFGQHPQLSARLAEALQGGFGGVPMPQALGRYFVHGRFDLGDIVAALLGALAAGAILRLTKNKDTELTHAN